MGTRNGTLRRVAAAFSLALGVFAVTGAPAGAAAAVEPTLSGSAGSQALRVSLQVKDLLVFDQAIALMGANADRSADAASAQGFAALRSGSCGVGDLCTTLETTLDALCGSTQSCAKLDDIQNASVSTACIRGGACDGTRKVGAFSLPLGELEAGELVVKSKFGELNVDGATSSTPNWDRTTQTTGAVELSLDLADLLEAQGIEASGLLDTLYNAVNGTALPEVNKVISTVKPNLDGLLKTLGLEDYVTIGTIKDIPDIRSVKLLEGTVTSAMAKLSPKVSDEALGVLAQSSSKLTDLSILGGWVTAEAIGLKTEAYANGVAGDTGADIEATLADVQIGGLLGLNIPLDLLADLVSLEKTKQGIIDAAPDALKSQAQDLVDVINLIQTIAGVEIRIGHKTEAKDPKGAWAKASAESLTIVVDPKIPHLSALTAKPADGSLIPTLDPAADFDSLGIHLEVALPQSTAFSSANANVLPFEPPTRRTGVGTPLIAGLGLLAGALMMRRFVLAK